MLASSRNSEGQLKSFASANLSKPAESVLKIAHEHNDDDDVVNNNNNHIRESFENKILSDLNHQEN